MSRNPGRQASTRHLTLSPHTRGRARTGGRAAAGGASYRGVRGRQAGRQRSAGPTVPLAAESGADLVTKALAAAIRTRGSLAGSIMHIDHGAPYTSMAFADACRSAGVRRSMSAVGSSAGNALAESFNATFTRDAPGPKELARRAQGPIRRLPMAPPLKHPMPRLPPRTHQPDRIRSRTHSTHYAGNSRITRVQDSGSRPLCQNPNFAEPGSTISDFHAASPH
ncbi:DDE-type integrase/transposase/recombinase [Streptomyces sp. NPDC090054]|uniref:DDE-type integrase/transposase/recombinase n=1 Tax=Streptomyces sp. NPDC090054 TaxID=3365933 RepID=UPI00380094D9